MLIPNIRRVLDGTSIAHIATVQADGAPHVVPIFVGTEGDRIAVFTGPTAKKVENLRGDPRVALSIAPNDNPFEPVVVRGHVVEWIDGDPAWEIIDRIATKYTGQAYPRELERIVMLIEPDRQTVGIG